MSGAHGSTSGASSATVARNWAATVPSLPSAGSQSSGRSSRRTTWYAVEAS